MRASPVEAPSPQVSWGAGARAKQRDGSELPEALPALAHRTTAFSAPGATRRQGPSPGQCTVKAMLAPPRAAPRGGMGKGKRQEVDLAVRLRGLCRAVLERELEVKRCAVCDPRWLGARVFAQHSLQSCAVRACFAVVRPRPRGRGGQGGGGGRGSARRSSAGGGRGSGTCCAGPSPTHPPWWQRAALLRRQA